MKKHERVVPSRMPDRREEPDTLPGHASANSTQPSHDRPRRAWAIGDPSVQKTLEGLVEVDGLLTDVFREQQLLGKGQTKLEKEVGMLSGLVRSQSAASADFAEVRAKSDVAREARLAERDADLVIALASVTSSNLRLTEAVNALTVRVGALDGKVAEAVEKVEETGRHQLISEAEIDEEVLALKTQQEVDRRVVSERVRSVERVAEVMADGAVKEALLTVRADGLAAAAAGVHAAKTADDALAVEKVKADASVKVAWVTSRQAIIIAAIAAIPTILGIVATYLAMRGH